MEKVQELALKAMKVVSQLNTRNKAYLCEKMTRWAFKAISQCFDVIPQLHSVALGIASPSSEAISELKLIASGAVLKQMENYGNADIGQSVGEFVDFVIEEFYLGWAGGKLAKFMSYADNLGEAVYYCVIRQ